MSTPRRIEFNQDILLVVENDIFIILCNNDRNRTFLLLWDGLRLDAGVDFPIEIVRDEFANFLLGDLFLLVERKLLVFDSLLNRKRWPCTDFQIQVSGVCAKSARINGSEVDSTLVLFSNRLYYGCELSSLFWSLCEYKAKR
jgi:hypothetical protein